MLLLVPWPGLWPRPGRCDMDSRLLLVLIVMGVVGLVLLGYWLAERDLTEARDDLDIQRHVLDTERAALENLRRVNDVFFAARDDLRRAEQAHRPRPASTSGPGLIDGEWE
jgi:hypothetical protein